MLAEAKQEIKKLERENFDLRKQVKKVRISYEKEIDEYSEVNFLLLKRLYISGKLNKFSQLKS